MRIQLLDLARIDLLEGYHFYEEQEPGLGGYFIDSLFSDIDSLRLYAGIHRKAYKDLHRALSKRFPFAIYYSVEEEAIRVRSIVDAGGIQAGSGSICAEPDGGIQGGLPRFCDFRCLRFQVSEFT